MAVSTASADRPLTEKQEKFAVLRANGASQADAYAEAFGKDNWKRNSLKANGHALEAQANIARRIQEIRDAAAKQAGLTLAKHMEDLLLLRNRAVQAGNWAAAISAEVSRGKAAGLYVDKAEVTNTLKKASELPSSVDDFV